MPMRRLLLGLLAIMTASLAWAQSFTYQGSLKENGVPANGSFDFRFMLWTQPTGGVQVGPELYVDAVAVQNGLFTVPLDFGSVWDGSDRYLEIMVRRVGHFGYWLLQPRVKITPTPYAAFALRPWQTAGSAVFYNDGNVGIGTSNPAARLSLGGGDANTKLALWQGGSAGEVMGFGIGPNQFRLHLHNPANRFSFLNAPNGSELLTILGNGNVGIGLTAPAAKLHIRDGNLRIDGGVIQSWGPITLHPDVDNSGDDIVRIVDSGGTEVMRVHSNGNVGIGTTNPQARLHVDGNAYLTSGSTTLQILPGNLFGSSQANAATLEIPGNGVIGVWDDLSVNGSVGITGNLHVGGDLITVGGGTDSNWSRVRIGLTDVGNSLYAGFVRVDGANGNRNARITSITGYPNHGLIEVLDTSGTAQAQMFIQNDGNGWVVADAKSFRVPDPDDPTRDIWYGCLEGPELAMYVRGTARLVNGRARIELPDHFRKLADEQGMTVQLTPLSPASKGLCVLRKGLDGVEVAELMNGTGNYEFDWRVEAVRKEHRDFRVYRPWDEVMAAGDDPAKAWEARLKSIQDRLARQQTSKP